MYRYKYRNNGLSKTSVDAEIVEFSDGVFGFFRFSVVFENFSLTGLESINFIGVVLHFDALMANSSGSVNSLYPSINGNEFRSSSIFSGMYSLL